MVSEVQLAKDMQIKENLTTNQSKFIRSNFHIWYNLNYSENVTHMFSKIAKFLPRAVQSIE